MIFMRAISKVILFVFLSVAVALKAEAKPSEEIVLCPKPDRIHQAASLLNHVKCQEGFCYVNTGNDPAFYDNGQYWWLTLMQHVTDSSEDEAVLKAQNIAKEATVMFSETVFMYVLCGYYVTSSDLSNNEVIGIFAFGSPKKTSAPLIHTLLGNK